MNKETIIKKIADGFTDTFGEQISDYLISFDLETNDENIDLVLKEIVNIYKRLLDEEL
tara:strand:- start:171 stop:344 length:174 start_codon:yes stop_codon:yes gene_type:complete